MAKDKFNLKLPENYSMLDDFVNRFEANLKIQPILESLSKKYDLGLLTNMYPGMLNAIKSKGILPNITWKTIVDSSVEGFRKPQEEIYIVAENKAQVKSENILFIENSPIHIKTAEKRGWQTILYDPSNVDESNKLIEQLLN